MQRLFRLMLTASFILCLALPALAQETPLADPAAAAAAAAVETQRQQQLNMPFRDSLLFSPLEIAAIRSATAGKPPGSGMLEADKATYIPPRRVISLAGVVYRKSDDWIVWLNGQKVLPRQLLPEIVDITVEDDVVHLKWFDIGMNKIISISLRPHQTYDIVTGLLLPG